MNIRPFILSCLRGCPRIRFCVISTEGRNPKLRYFQCNKISRYARNNNIGEFSNRLLDQEGAVLIGLIVTMVILAVLGVAMFSLTGTSTFSQVGANSSTRAYYLAESGYRYIESEFQNTGDTDNDGEEKDDKNHRLQAIHNTRVFSLRGNSGNFQLKVYPYYLVTSASHVKGSTNLQTTFCGKQPADLTIPAAGRLKIGTDPPYRYTSYDSGTGTFTLSSGLLSAVSDYMDIYLAANPTSSGTMTKDGNLRLANASFFPDRNGNFKIDGKRNVYAYKTRNGNTLQNITDADDPGRDFSVSVSTNTDIVLEPFLKLHSTGTFGQGSAATSREIVYRVPIRHPSSDKFIERFETKYHWKEEAGGASALGRHEITMVQGGKALKVAGTSKIPSTQFEGTLIELDWPTTGADLASAWAAAGKRLSYDVQVKIRVDREPYYMPGISFRLDNNANCYGVSFLNASPNNSDGIPDELVPPPPAKSPMVVLWQQTNGGTDRTWVAYKNLADSDYVLSNDIYFTDDMESGKSKWQADRPWDQITSDYHSKTYCWTDSPVGDYAEHVDTSLETKSINLSGASSKIST